MNKRHVSGIRAALFDSDLILPRLMLAGGEMFWAVLLIWPGDTFARPTYSLMSQIAPEMVWALAFLATSMAQYRIVALRLCDTTSAWLFSCWNSLLWATVVACMLASVYPPPAAISGEIILTLVASWIWARPIINKLGERKYAATLAH